MSGSSLAALLALGAVLAACGGTAGTPAVDQPARNDAADVPPEAGVCVEDVEEIEECVDTDDGPGSSDDSGDGALDHDAVILEAQSLIGESEQHLNEFWPEVRIGRRGDEEMMLTQDHVPGRMTAALEDDGTGTYRVVEVVVETDEGSETVVPIY